MARRLRVLMSAYACEPGRGSEPGLGWNWVLQAARFHEVWVLTRADNRDAIERELERRPMPNLHFVYHDLPRWSRFWKRGTRGLQPYYLLWQLTAVPLCRRLNQQFGFDVAHHVTFGTYRHPSCLAWLPCPFIWGPIGGADRAPLAFYRSFGMKRAIQELLRDTSNLATHLNPLVRHTIKKSCRILVATEATRMALPHGAQEKSLVVPVLGLEMPPERKTSDKPRPNDRFSVLYVGRLIHWKGPQLAIRAFARFANRAPDAVLTLDGDGPDHGNLERLATRIGLGSRVRFQCSPTAEEALRVYEHHDVLLFPSLHDAGGMVPVEAMSRGLPVICLDRGRPQR